MMSLRSCKFLLDVKSEGEELIESNGERVGTDLVENMCIGALDIGMQIFRVKASYLVSTEG